MIKKILALGLVALATGVGVRVLVSPTPAVAVPDTGASRRREPFASAAASMGGKHAYWRSVWTRPAPSLADLSLSPDGKYVAWVDTKGSIRRLNTITGQTQWQTPPQDGVNRVLALPGGAVLTYAYLNPASSVVRVLDPMQGAQRTTSYGLEGAVWSAAVAARGSHVIVGTGRSLMYVLPMQSLLPTTPPMATASMTPAAPPVPVARPTRFAVQGIPDTVAVTEKGGMPLIVAGTWQDAGLCAWGLDGAARWRHDEEQNDRTFTVRLSADGTTAASLSTRGAKGTEARLQLWDTQSGRLLWGQDLAISEAQMLLSADGRYVAVSYLRDVDGNGILNPASERRVVMFDRKGLRVFGEKGGVFFAPRLVALSADGQRLTVRDNGGMLCTLDAGGNILRRLPLGTDPRTGMSPTIQETLCSTDGRTLLLRLGDGQIALYKAMPQ